MDNIYLRDLRLPCIIGITPDEQRQPTNISLTIVLDCDLAPATLTDDIADTLSYSKVYDLVRETVQESKCHLLEALAEKIAQVCLRESRVKAATIKIEKVGIFVNCAAAGVEIHRARKANDLR